MECGITVARKNNRFNKGQMVTGEVNIKNSEGNIKTYHLNNDGACTNPYRIKSFLIICYKLFGKHSPLSGEQIYKLYEF